MKVFSTRQEPDLRNSLTLPQSCDDTLSLHRNVMWIWSNWRIQTVKKSSPDLKQLCGGKSKTEVFLTSYPSSPMPGMCSPGDFERHRFLRVQCVHLTLKILVTSQVPHPLARLGSAIYLWQTTVGNWAIYCVPRMAFKTLVISKGSSVNILESSLHYAAVYTRMW